MKSEEQSQIVKTWIEHHKKGRSIGKPPADTFWAWEQLNDIVSNNPALAWELILQILATDQSDITIGNLAAGPLEDFLVHHGAEYIDRVEAQAKNNPDFNQLLGGVWENEISTDVWSRVQKARKRVW